MMDSQSPKILDDPNSFQSVSDRTRRHSLPTHFLPSSTPNRHVFSTHLVVESEEAARGEHTIDQAAIAHRLSALRQLNGGRATRHRYAKSTGARSSTYSQPVIVRTYSGTIRPRSQHRDPLGVRKENIMTKSKGKANAKLPPIEAFTFKGIMDEIKHDVSEDLERIAEICARSKYSLSNQYEVHMPPHGQGEGILQRVATGPPLNGIGPTLQAVESDDEQPRMHSHTLRGSRRTRSVAYGTLETIMSSSRSSDEDQSKKKPAADLVEEVRGRVARKNAANSQLASQSVNSQGIAGRTRSKSISFATALLESGSVSKRNDLLSSGLLVSEPAQPQTSLGVDNLPSTTVYPTQRSTRLEHMSKANTPREVRHNGLPDIVEGITSWLPWNKQPNSSNPNAEGSLKVLLHSSRTDKSRPSPD